VVGFHVKRVADFGCDIQLSIFLFNFSEFYLKEKPTVEGGKY